MVLGTSEIPSGWYSSFWPLKLRKTYFVQKEALGEAQQWGLSSEGRLKRLSWLVLPNGCLEWILWFLYTA